MPDTKKNTHLAFPSGASQESTCLNLWADESEAPFALLARAYHKAGKRLAQNPKLDRGGLSNFDAYPVVFLYRHAMELYLKAVLQELGELSQKCLSTHDLRELLPPIRRQFEKWGIEKKLGTGDVATFDDLERLVRDLYAVDGRSDAFRYPINKHGESALPRGFKFSVVDFARRFDPVLDMLSGAVSLTDERLQIEAEIRAEAVTEMSDWY